MDQEIDIFDSELPPRSNNRPIDIETLNTLWFKTIKDAIKKLSLTQPDKKLLHIYKLDENGNGGSYEIMAPEYQIFDEDHIRIVITEGKEFLDYLWECGKPKVRMSPRNRSSWDHWVTSRLILRPISRMLDDSSICQFVDNQKIMPWAINDTQIDEYISDASVSVANNKVIIHVYCPIYGVKLNGFQSAKVSEYTTLKSYSNRDISILMSKYLTHLNVDKMEFITQDSMAEIRFELDLKEGGPIEQEFKIIDDELDLVKLGIFLLENQKQPIGDRKWTIPIQEGTCILDTVGRDINIPSHSRGPILMVSGKGELYKTDIECLISIIKSLYEQQKKERDIEHAIWLFGRSCLAPLYRDVLLDSAIGLESLLVQDKNLGNFTYRFCLHGKIILANNDETIDDFKILNDIYRGRSGAAHGKEGKKDIRELAFSSRQYLAQTIFNICLLWKNGLLSSDKKLLELIKEKSVLISNDIFD